MVEEEDILGKSETLALRRDHLHFECSFTGAGQPHGMGMRNDQDHVLDRFKEAGVSIRLPVSLKNVRMVPLILISSGFLADSTPCRQPHGSTFADTVSSTFVLFLH